MPFVAPQFEGEGDAGQAFNQGQSAGMSMMERAQQMEQRGAQEERQKAIFQAGLPLLQAKNQADLAEAHDKMAQFVDLQDQRQQILPILQQARNKFNQNQLIPDINDRATANTQWLGQYSQIANLPEYQKEFDNYNHLSTQTTQSQQKILALTNANVLAEAKYEALLKQQAMKGQTAENVQTLKNTGLLGATTLKTAASTQNAETRANTEPPEVKIARAHAQAVVSGDTDTANALEQYQLAQGHMAPTQMADSFTKMADNEEKLASVAKQNGDEPGYQQGIANVAKLRAKAIEYLQAQPKTAPKAASAPVPSQASIEHLKANPNLAKIFDDTYGAGASKQYLTP